MQMIALGNRFMDGGLLCNVIAFEDDYLLEVIRQHPSCHESRYTAADYYSLFTEMLWHKCPRFDGLRVKRLRLHGGDARGAFS
jgi:hypothetical protein